jgi:hypothetical protein
LSYVEGAGLGGDRLAVEERTDHVALAPVDPLHSGLDGDVPTEQRHVPEAHVQVGGATGRPAEVRQAGQGLVEHQREAPAVGRAVGAEVEGCEPDRGLECLAVADHVGQDGAERAGAVGPVHVVPRPVGGHVVHVRIEERNGPLHRLGGLDSDTGRGLGVGDPVLGRPQRPAEPDQVRLGVFTLGFVGHRPFLP